MLFTLYLKEDVNEDGSIKPAALEAAAIASGGQGHTERPTGDEFGDDDDDGVESFDEDKAIDEARRKLSGVDLKSDKPAETNDDDID